MTCRYLCLFESTCLSIELENRADFWTKNLKFQKMNSKTQRKKIPVKTIYHHVIRAKLYAILTVNALEGMMLEMNNLISADMNRSRIESMSDYFRQL